MVAAAAEDGGAVDGSTVEADVGVGDVISTDRASVDNAACAAMSVPDVQAAATTASTHHAQLALDPLTSAHRTP